jgi:hypothetical protein
LSSNNIVWHLLTALCKSMSSCGKVFWRHLLRLPSKADFFSFLCEFYKHETSMKLQWTMQLCELANGILRYLPKRPGDCFNGSPFQGGSARHFFIFLRPLKTRVKARHVGCKAKASRSRRPSQLPIVFTEVGKGLQPKTPKRWPPWRLKRPFQKPPEKTRFIGSTGTKNNRTYGSLRFILEVMIAILMYFDHVRMS